MASPFVKTTTIPSIQGYQQIKQAPQTVTPQNNIFLYGNRRNPTSSETTGLPILQPNVGYPFYEYYKTYQLPSQYVNDGLALLSYFQSCGFSVGYGYSASQTFYGSNTTTYVDDTTLASLDQSIVYYKNASSLVAPLVGAQVSGTFEDDTAPATGIFISAEIGTFNVNSDTYDSKIILQSVDFADINNADVITISFTDASILTPDPAQTEPFLMNLYQAALAANIPQNENSTTSAPNVYFAFLPNTAKSGYFGPTASAQTLSVPTAQTATTITFAIPSSNVNLIPLSALGNTTITQAVSLAEGTIVSAQVNGTILIVTLSNITGTFDTTNVCTLHLDATQTIFTFQQKLFANNKISLAQFPMIYPVLSNTDITTTYATAFQYLTAINLPQTSQDGQSVAQIVFGNITIAENLATLTLASNVDNWYYEPVYYPYVPAIGDLPLTTGQLTSAYCMVVGSNVSPLNPQGGVIINGLPVLANKDYYINVQINGIADQVQKLGWNVIAVNNNQQPYVVNPRTGQTTIPGTSVPDTEFYLEYVPQTVDLLKKNVIVICQASGVGQVRQTPKVLSKLKSDIISVMLDMENDGMLLNVEQNEAYVTIIQDPDNPLGIDINIPTQIVPGLEQVYFTINIFSSTTDLTTAA